MKKRLKMLAFSLLPVFIITISALSYSKDVLAVEGRTITNFVGQLEIVHADDFLNPQNSTYEYYIRGADKVRYRLHPVNENGISRNEKVLIKEGTQLGLDIYGEVSSLFVDIEAIPDIIAYHGSSEIRWQAEEATSCTGTGGSVGWAGPKNVEGGSFMATNLEVNTTYTITCVNAFDTITKSTIVTVALPSPSTYIQNLLGSYISPESSAPTPYNVAVFLVNPIGSTIPFTTSDANGLVFNGQAQNFIRESSLNKKYLAGDVFGWIQADIPANSLKCQSNFVPTMEDGSSINIPEVVSYVTNNSVHLENYQHVLFIMNCGNLGGASTVGIKTQTLNNIDYNFSRSKVGINVSAYLDQKSNSINFPNLFPWTNFDNTLAHELIHGFGSKHIGGLDCDTVAIGENCIPVEYGNVFDIMGFGAYSLHNNAVTKKILGWIKPPQYLNITQSGTYTINSLEYPVGLKMARIKNPSFVDDDVEYMVENRRGSGFDRTLNYPGLVQNQNGLLINRYDKDSNGFFDSELIDASPSSLIWFKDTENAALTDSNTFTDTARGITIGPITNVSDTNISFNVTFNQVSNCVRANPTITTTFPLTYDISEQIRPILIRAKNNDTLECGDSNFSGEILTVAGNPLSSLSYQEQKIGAQQERGLSWLNQIPTNTPPGAYTFKAVFTNIDLPNYKVSVPFVVNVVE